jgi:hypothetical protein
LMPLICSAPSGSVAVLVREYYDGGDEGSQVALFS